MKNNMEYTKKLTIKKMANKYMQKVLKMNRNLMAVQSPWRVLEIKSEES